MDEKCTPSRGIAARTSRGKWRQYIWPTGAMHSTCPRSETHDGERLAREVTLRMIVSGATQSPVAADDMERWLERQGTDEADEAARVVSFLRDVERYTTLFLALPTHIRSAIPTPFDIISELSLLEAPKSNSEAKNTQSHVRQASADSSMTDASWLRTMRYSSSAPLSSGLGTATRATSLPDVPESPSVVSSLAGEVESRRGGRSTPAVNRYRLPGSGGVPTAPRPPSTASEGDDDIDGGVPSAPRSKLAAGLGGASKRVPSRQVVSGYTGGSTLSAIISGSTTLSSESTQSTATSVSQSESPESPGPPRVPLAQPRPLRTELDRILTLYLQPSSSESITPLIPAPILRALELESELTTHPDIFQPLLDPLYAHITHSQLHAFLQDAVRNLHRHTALGRLLIGLSTSLVGLTATVLLLLDPSPFTLLTARVDRPWRLLLIPILLGGLGYAYGAREGMCFWLALFGVREEPGDANDAPSGALDAVAMWWEARSHRRQMRQSEGSRRPRNKLRKRGSLRPKYADGESQAGTGVRGRSGSTASTSTTNGAELSESLWVMFWRLTGTAWDVRKVEDPILRRYQRRAAWRIAAVLTVVLLCVGVVLYVLPFIPCKDCVR